MFARISQLIAVALLLSLHLSAVAETLSLERADGTDVLYYLDRPDGLGPYPMATILQGSDCLRVSDKYAPFIAAFKARGVAVLRVEKPGLGPDVEPGVCPPDYLRLNSPNRRVLDLLAVLAELRRTDSRWNGDLGLVGGSEGAMTAALTAPLSERTRAVLLFSGGGGLPFKDEVSASIAMDMRAGGASEKAVTAQMETARKTWGEISHNPTPDKEWASDGKLSRNTYLYWNEAMNLTLYQPLLQVQVPILSYAGTGDLNIPVDSARELEARFRQAGRTNLEMRYYDGQHSPSPELIMEGLDWICCHLTHDNSQAPAR